MMGLWRPQGIWTPGLRVYHAPRTAGAPPASAPDDITGLWGWWKSDVDTYQDASFATPATSDADPILGWKDQSGNSRHMSCSTASLVTLRTNVVNSLPVLRFNNGIGFDITPNPSALTSAEVFIVVKVTRAAGIQNALWHFSSQAGGAGFEWFPFSDGNIYDGFGSDTRKTLGTPIVDLRTAFRLFNVITASGEYTANLDGGQQFTTATNTVGWFGTPLVGRGGGESLEGDIAEFFIYDNKISAGDRTAIETYIQTRYGLTF